MPAEEHVVAQRGFSLVSDPQGLGRAPARPLSLGLQPQHRVIDSRGGSSSANRTAPIHASSGEIRYGSLDRVVSVSATWERIMVNGSMKPPRCMNAPAREA